MNYIPPMRPQRLNLAILKRLNLAILNRNTGAALAAQRLVDPPYMGEGVDPPVGGLALAYVREDRALLVTVLSAFLARSFCEGLSARLRHEGALKPIAGCMFPVLIWTASS